MAQGDGFGKAMAAALLAASLTMSSIDAWVHHKPVSKPSPTVIALEQLLEKGVISEETREKAGGPVERLMGCIAEAQASLEKGDLTKCLHNIISAKGLLAALQEMGFPIHNDLARINEAEALLGQALKEQARTK